MNGFIGKEFHNEHLIGYQIFHPVIKPICSDII